MYFLVSDNKEVLSNCKTENEISMMVTNFFSSYLKVPAIEAVSWCVVAKDGYFYHKNGKDYELREYKFLEGYIYNTLRYDIIGKYHISSFECNLKSNLKTSFVDAVNSLDKKRPEPIQIMK